MDYRQSNLMLNYADSRRRNSELKENMLKYREHVSQRFQRALSFKTSCSPPDLAVHW